MSLSILACADNRLSAVDISGASMLGAFDCSRNNILELDTSGNKSLSILYCDNNRIKALNLSGCTALTDLRCGDNDLTALDVSDCVSMKILGCYVNKIMTLDLSGKSTLTSLGCSENELASLNITGCVSLDFLNCSNNNLTAVDISDSSFLRKFYCSENKISVLDVSKNIALTELRCFSNDLTALDVSFCTSLDTLYCNNNRIKALDVSGNTAITDLKCGNNQLKALDVSGLAKLTELSVTENPISSLNLRGNTLLEKLWCYSCDLSELDVSRNTALTELWCGNNPIRTLNVRNNTALLALYCNGNQLRTLDLSRNSELERLSCVNNELYELDLSNNKALKMLECNLNFFTNFDISNNTALTELYCPACAIRELDLSRHTALVSLDCRQNDLVTLDLSRNTALRSVMYEGNCTMPMLSVTSSDRSGYPFMIDVKQYVGSNNAGKVSYVSGYDKNSGYIATVFDSSECAAYFTSSPVYIVYGYNTGSQALASGIADFRMSIQQYHFVYIAKVESRFSNALKNTSANNDDNATEKSAEGGITASEASADTSPKYRLNENYSGEITEYLQENSFTPEYHSGSQSDKSTLEAFTPNRSTIEAAARVMNVSSKDIKLLSNLNIGTAKQPGQETEDLISSEGYSIIESFNTLTANESGCYLFKVILSDVLFLQLREQDARTLKLFAVISSDLGVSSSAVKSGGNCELLSLSGSALETVSTREILAACFLTANTPANMYLAERVSNIGVTSSSSGGCNSGGEILLLLPILFALPALGFSRAFRKSGAKILVILLFLSGTPESFAKDSIKVSDYVKPIDYTMYDIKGTCETDIDLTDSLVNAVKQACERYYGYSPRNIRTYRDSDILSHTWDMTPYAMYTLAMNGLHVAAQLPVIHAPENVSSDRDNRDFYVVMCTFSDDVQPGELIDGCSNIIDITAMKYSPDVYPEGEYTFYEAQVIAFDENLNYIDAVPQNRRAYIAYSPEATGNSAGIIGIIRGEYVEESDPLSRISDESARKIADFYEIPVENLKFLSRGNMYTPFEPTQAMKEYVSKDGHEIIANLPTLSVDQDGLYAFPITLPDSVWNEVRSKDISSFKFYALNDDGVRVEDMHLKPLSGDAVKTSFVTGLLSTWEVFSLTGNKLEQFGVKEFLLVGVLSAGKPFSLYLAKLILMFLLGGCNSGIYTAGIIAGLVFAFVLLKMKFHRKN